MTKLAIPTTRSIVIERVMPHPPEKIWRALTQGHLIEEWLMKNDFQPVVGHKFNFRAEPMPGWNGVTDCEVLIVEPNERLSYRWDRTERSRGQLLDKRILDEGFDPGSERTLAAWIRHASRTNPTWVTGWGKWRKGQ